MFTSSYVDDGENFNTFYVPFQRLFCLICTTIRNQIIEKMLSNIGINGNAKYKLNYIFRVKYYIVVRFVV